jgi:hypothetical protein
MSCKKLVEVDGPSTSMNSDIVYAMDATAIAVLTNIYANNMGNATDKIASMSLFPGLSADELKLFSGVSDPIYLFYYQNNLSSSVTGPMDYWVTLYNTVFVTNAAIEGLNSSKTLTPSVKKQLLGEAKFMRAFCYFYLVNLYGDVPLNLTTDYKANGMRPRTDKGKVYEQIMTDLKDAQGLLSDEYLNASMTITEERVRPNKSVASAMLARVYLYTGRNTEAEAEATSIITNKKVYDMVTLNQVFLKNSLETIWALQPTSTGTDANTGEGRLFILTSLSPPSPTLNPVYLQDNLVGSFEATDKRKSAWIGKYIDPDQNSNIYHYSYKYQVRAVEAPTTEYSVVFRLAEQYLIRAEARVKQGNIDGAASDLNIIRKRAGLEPTTAITQEGLIGAILNERRWELFTEWGHRWFDLKRTGKVDEIMQQIKGTYWQTTDQLYPIPQTELNGNPNIRGYQNPGYD